MPHPLSPAGLAVVRLRARRLARHPDGARARTVVREVQVRPRSFAPPARGGHPLPRRRHRGAGPVPLQLHPAGLPRPAARGHQHRAGELAVRAALLAALPAGDRDPPAHHLARLPGARASSAAAGRSTTTTLNVPLPGAPVPRAGHRRPRRIRRPRTPPGASRSTQAVAGVAAPVNRQDMDALRVEVERIAGARALSGLPSNRLGRGIGERPGPREPGPGPRAGVRWRGRPQGAAGRAAAVDRLRHVGPPRHRGARGDGRPRRHPGRACPAERRIRDLSDLPVISPVLNSILSQEGGQRLRRLRAAQRRRRSASDTG